MRRLRALWLRLVDPFVRARRERDFAAEIESHLQLHIDDNLKTGMDHHAARRSAVVRLGGVESMKDAYRDRRGLPFVENFVRDVRFGWRLIVRQPGFSAVALAALTIGVGANVAIFSFTNALLLRPLPILDPPSVVRVFSMRSSNTAYSSYKEYRDANRTLSGLAAFNGVSLSLRGSDVPEHIFGMVVSGNYFNVLGVGTALGRPIVPGDDEPGSAGAVVLSDGAWRRRFGADPTVVGRSVTLNSHRYTVVGVAPPRFTGTMAPLVPDVWVPLNGPGTSPPRPASGEDPDASRSVQMIGRLKPDTTIVQAQTDLAALASGIARRSPGERQDFTATVYPARNMIEEFSPAITLFVGLLSGIVGLVLLLTCVNIANLLLARSAARRREIGVRLALGAGRVRLLAQLLTESMVLGAIGTALGVALAFALTRVVSALDLPTPIPIRVDLSFDGRIALFSVAITLVTTMLFGLAPAWRSSKTDFVPSLKDGTAGARQARSRLRASLVTAQVALSTVLLVTGAVLGRSLVSARSIDRGFVGDHVLTASLDLTTGGYTNERGVIFFDQLLNRLRQTPGVAAANIVEIVPLTLSNNEQMYVTEGQDEAPAGTPRARFNSVTPGHFATLGIPLLAGRDFTAADTATSPAVVIVNETLARTYWPGSNPIGKRIRAVEGQGRFGPWIDVIGLARESKYTTIGEEARPFFYRPLAQTYQPAVTLLVKATGEPMSALPAVRAAVQAVDPELPLFNISPLDSLTGISLLPVQMAAAISGSLGVVALLLAAIGLYGVMSYLVRQRTAEIGTRIALGARPWDVIRALTRQGMRWTVVGLTLGLVASFLVTRLLTSLLYGVGATDLIAFGGIAVVLTATSGLACYLPARRASRLDPVAALRSE